MTTRRTIQTRQKRMSNGCPSLTVKLAGVGLALAITSLQK
jgi:hypothetical protein